MNSYRFIFKNIYCDLIELYLAQKCCCSLHSSTQQILSTDYHFGGTILRNLGYIREQQRILMLNKEERQQISKLHSRFEGEKKITAG